ncbi:MAG: hypothetical protein PSV13_08200, partial [Lacunisphaera sp.]|nr:hypothetical protein [Lacunisphaera sp.]
PAKPAPAASSGPVGASVTPAIWQTLKPGSSLHDLVANLRAAGFPPAVVRAVVSQMVAERLSSPGLDDLPFWKKNFNNPEYRAAQEQMNTDRRNLLTELLGPDARPSAMMDPASRERRYGSLSDDKIDQIETINRDFNELRMKLFADRKPGDTQNPMAVQAGLEQEVQKDLAAILTPAELEQFEMRSSPSASRVMGNLKGLEVTEAEYTALFRAQKAYDSVDPLRTGDMTADTMVLRAAAQEELNEQARAVLTDDRFYEYLKASDSTYAQTAQFTASYPAITPATTYELAQIERNYQAAMMAGARRSAGGAPSSERMAQLTAARTEYQDRINTLLGPETAAVYAQRNRTGVISIAPAGRIGP